MAFVLVGAILQTSAYTVAHLIVGRVITGVGTGIKTSTVPMYVVPFPTSYFFISRTLG